MDGMTSQQSYALTVMNLWSKHLVLIQFTLRAKDGARTKRHAV